MRFVMRSGAISDRFGEKLNEAFVADALRHVGGGRWVFAMLAPSGDHYTLFAQGDLFSRDLRELDFALAANPHYAYCRQLGQLRPVAGFRIAQRGDAAYLDRLRQRGQRLGDIKPCALSLLDGWETWFDGEAIEP